MRSRPRKPRALGAGIRTYLLIPLRVAIPVGIFFYLFQTIPASKVAAIVSSARVPHVLAAFLILFLTHLLTGYRLKLVAAAQAISLSTPQATEINVVAVFYALFVPGGNLAGAALRIHRLFRAGDRMTGAVASVALDRIAATVSLCLVGMVFWLAHLPNHTGHVAFILLVVLGLSTLALVYLLWGRLPRSLSRRLRTHERWPARIQRLIETVKRCRNLSANWYGGILSLSIAAQLLGVLIYYQLASSVGMDVSFAALAWIRAAALVVAMLPISISGVGIREGALIVLLEGYGVSGEQALAFSLLVFSVTIVTIGALGGLLEGRRLITAS